MSKVIQIRGVPDAVYRKLCSRSTRAGMTLSDYLRGELEMLVARLANDELRARLRSLSPVNVRETPAAAVRAERDSG